MKGSGDLVGFLRACLRRRRDHENGCDLIISKFLCLLPVHFNNDDDDESCRCFFSVSFERRLGFHQPFRNMHFLLYIFRTYKNNNKIIIILVITKNKIQPVVFEHLDLVTHNLFFIFRQNKNG